MNLIKKYENLFKYFFLFTSAMNFKSLIFHYRFTKTKKIIQNVDYLIEDKSFEKNLKETMDWYKK